MESVLQASYLVKFFDADYLGAHWLFTLVYLFEMRELRLLVSVNLYQTLLLLVVIENVEVRVDGYLLRILLCLHGGPGLDDINILRWSGPPTGGLNEKAAIIAVSLVVIDQDVVLFLLLQLCLFFYVESGAPSHLAVEEIFDHWLFLGLLDLATVS